MPVGKCNYCIECMRCQESGTKAQYWGESARTGYKRGKEHLQALRKGDEESSLVKHAIINHQGEIPDFQMRVERQHQTPFSRQISEAVAIDTCKADIILNSKAEYNGEKVPRVVLEVGGQ